LSTSEAARALGSVRSEKKRASAVRNGALRRKPLSEFPCTCGRGDAEEGHPTTCPRGRVIWRRKRAALKSETPGAATPGVSKVP